MSIGSARLALTLALPLLSPACADSPAQPAGNRFDAGLQRVFSRLEFRQPVAMLQAPGDGARFYVVEKAGRVLVFDNRAEVAGAAVYFADAAGRVDAGPNEAGLLGMAFHPDFTRNAQVYLSYTRDGSPLVSYISRFTVTGGTVEQPSEMPVLTLAQPYGNHNGGQIGFGPDGYLYAGFGDGGSGGDPRGHGQNPHSLLGAMLRLDVNGAAPYAIPPDNPFAASSGCGSGCPELYAWGLRNPWRWSFDRQTGELWLADVGQNEWEEVNRIEAGGNYGWAVREGAHCFRPPSGCDRAGLIDPVAEYDHEQGFSVTGGYVYRGSALPALRGYYLYGDFGSGRVWALDTAGAGARPELLLRSGLNVSAFAEDLAGEIYLLDYAGGGIHKLVPQP